MPRGAYIPTKTRRDVCATREIDRKIPSESERRGGIKASALSQRRALQPVKCGLSGRDNRCRGLRALPLPRPGCIPSP
jgi:hypothetical protein